MKKVQKTLTGALATMMAAGMVPVTAMAATNFDALHKAAYDAVKVAQETKTQKDINAARALVAEYKAAIIAEGKDGLLVNINTFSELLDVVQGPVLSEIVKAVLAMQEAGTATQAEINAVRTLMEGDQADDSDNLPASLTEAVKTWSSAVDVFQKELLDAAVAAVKTAETEKTTSAIEAAKVLVADLSTAVREGIKNVATTLQERLDAITVITVTKAEISKTSVKLEFEALKEALRDVTIEVIDNNGDVVEVKAKKLLIEGETTATFEFKTALTERPDGVWYVNGFKVDAEAINLVNDVKSARNAEKLYQVLEKSSLVSGLVDEVANQNEYYRLVGERKAEKINTVADVQKVIDDANKNVGVNDLVEDAVKAATEGTLNQFKKAFAKLDLERVNNEWIKTYRDALRDSNVTTLSQVQDIVDEKNNVEVVKAESDLYEDNKLNAEKIEKAMDLIETYVVVEEDDKDAQKEKDARLAALNVKLAIVRVNDSDTQASLKSALTMLEKAVNNEKTFKYDSLVNENLMGDYVKARVNDNNENTRFFESVQEIVEFLAEVETTQVEAAIRNLEKVSSEIRDLAEDKKDTKKTALMNAFKKLAAVSAKAQKGEIFDASLVKEDLYDLYAKAGFVGMTKVSDVIAQVKTVNNNIVSILFAQNTELTTENLLKTLSDSRLGLTNVVDGNEEAYKMEFPSFKIISNKNALVNLVSRVNHKEAVLAATTVSEVKTSLVEYAIAAGITTVTDVKDAVRTDIAEELLAIYTADNAPNKDVETLTVFEGHIADANNTRSTKIGNFNIEMVTGTPSITTAVAQLKIVSPEFKALDASKQLIVAEKVIANLPTHKDENGKVVKTQFANYTQIRDLVAKCL